MAQPAWRARQLMALALCQSDGRLEQGLASLAKAAELAAAAGQQPLRVRWRQLLLHLLSRASSSMYVTRPTPCCCCPLLWRLQREVAALQTHMQALQAASLAGGKAGAAAAAGKGPAAGAAAGGKPGATAAGAPPALAAAARRTGADQGGQLKRACQQSARVHCTSMLCCQHTCALPCALHAVDEDGALSILQWVLSSRPDAVAAEQQLRAAWKMVRVARAGAAAAAVPAAAGNSACTGSLRHPLLAVFVWHACRWTMRRTAPASVA